MNWRTLNLIDAPRRLHLQHREDDPTFLYVLLFVPDLIADRKVAYARADLQQCRFSTSSGGPVFWVGQTNFSISEQERRQIEEFLAQCQKYWERTPREQMNCGRCPLDARDPDHDCAAPDCLDDRPLLNAETMFSGRMNQDSGNADSN